MIIYFFIFSSGEISHQQQRRGREFNTEEGDVGEVSPQALQKCLAAAARRGIYGRVVPGHHELGQHRLEPGQVQ